MNNLQTTDNPIEALQLPEWPDTPIENGGSQETTYTPDKAKKILMAIAYDGQDLASAAKDQGTTRFAFMRWCGVMLQLRNAYQQARLHWCDSVAQKCNAEWSDLGKEVEAQHDDSNARLLHIKTNRLFRHTQYNQWLMSKYNPTYADKQHIDQTTRSVVLHANANTPQDVVDMAQALEDMIDPAS